MPKSPAGYQCLKITNVFLRPCGTPLVNMAGNSRPLDHSEPDRSGRPAESSQRHSMVVAGVVLLLGPLALPMLWRSRRLPNAWKIILTTLVLAVTLLIVSLLWYVFYKSLEPLRQLKQSQGY